MVTERDQEPVYAEGYKAFDASLPCPHDYGSFDYIEWWRGWQVAATSYLLNEFEKAAEL